MSHTSVLESVAFSCENVKARADARFVMHSNRKYLFGCRYAHPFGVYDRHFMRKRHFLLTFAYGIESLVSRYLQTHRHIFLIPRVYVTRTEFMQIQINIQNTFRNIYTYAPGKKSLTFDLSGSFYLEINLL